jgi:hypothetical protein
MRGTWKEKEIEICATNITNKTNCMGNNALKRGENCEDV